jgi:hypothetical protein
MTVDELTKLLTEQIDRVPDARDVPLDTAVMIAAIARWMHINQEGFAKPDLVHMQLECQVLIEMLQGTHTALGDLAADEDEIP